MPLGSGGDEFRFSVTSLLPTARQRLLALAVSVCILLAFGVVASIALVPLPRSDGYIPAVQAIIAATDFVTAVLLFGQFAIARSRALLVLASGYLFSASIVVAHTLTFPGAFAPTGLLGAGTQTAAWLYWVWHLGFPAAVIGYALLRREQVVSETSQPPASSAIAWTAITAVLAAGACTWVAIVGGESLPRVVVNTTSFNSLASFVTGVDLLASVIALAVLWVKRTSLLDEWLIVVLFAAIAETALVTFIGASRYTIAFYSGRVFALMVSSAVLVALLWEITRLYAKLSVVVRALQRERANQLLNLEVIVGSVAHEIKQPLTVIAMGSGTVRWLLKQPTPDLREVEENLAEMERAGVRASDTFDNIRALFRNPNEGHQEIDVNELVLAAVQILDADLSDHNIAISYELTGDLPPITGHKGQLQEVLINIVQNAIDALDTVTDRPRMLRVRTGRGNGKTISIVIEDSGPGIEPERLPKLFDAFMTTKARGMGLGLGICRMIVDRHDGRLSVSSELGKGTRFEINLPISLAASPERAPVAPGQSRSLKSMPYIRGSA